MMNSTCTVRRAVVRKPGVVLVLLLWSRFWSWSCKLWSWSCCSGLGLKNLVLFTSLIFVMIIIGAVHASHLWYPPFYTSPMASSDLQHGTTSPTKEGCHWQAGGDNRQTWQLANAAWHTYSLAHYCYDWHLGNRCGWTCNQLTSKVDGGITGSRLRWSILT